MPKIKVKLKRIQDNSYEVNIGSGLDIKKLLPRASRYVIISDSKVVKLYGEKMLKELKIKYQADLVFFSTGEKNKNREIKTRLEDQLIKLGCGRDTLIIALGGGVVGDLAGFVSATYMRGISYIQIPTTLLAMVDSSVGGKTAIDTPQGKNLIGAFWQPKKVVIDLDYLDTLPQEHLINGLIEAIKMFLTHDRQMFDYVEKNLAKILEKDKTVLQKIIDRAVKIKIAVVERDETEKNERVVLNFGHTIGHAIESISGYKLLHGYAVALGMLVEARMSKEVGVLSANSYERIKDLLSRLDINTKMVKRYNIKNIVRVLLVDKKNLHGKNRFVLLKDLGKTYIKNKEYVHQVNNKLVEQCLNLN